MDIRYKLVRSNRKSIGLQVSAGEVIVRAPYFISSYQIEHFVAEHEQWIIKQLQKQAAAKSAAASVKVMTPEQVSRLKKLAKTIVPQKIAYYAPLVGVSGRVKNIQLRCQKTRWGSCSSTGTICINYLLLLAPDGVLDSVVVHELCHLLEMNHSQKFYYQVRRVYPEYDKHQKWLKKNGAVLQAMVPENLR